MWRSQVPALRSVISTSLIDISSTWLELGLLTEAADLLVALCSSSLCLEEDSRLWIKLRQKLLVHVHQENPLCSASASSSSSVSSCCVFSFPSLVVPAVIPCPISPSLQVAIAWLSPFLAFVGDEAQVTPRSDRGAAVPASR